jgi:hypothetical protein
VAFYCEHGSEPVGDVTGWRNVTVSGRSQQPAISFMRDIRGVIEAFILLGSYAA